MKVVAYISGHGFGHLAQLAPVLNSLYAKQPTCQFLIRCSLPEQELIARLDFDFKLNAELVDLGVVQKSAIEEDIETSIKNMSLWNVDFDKHIQREVAVLQHFKADLVISNISPLAFPAARTLGIPSVGVATLDWYSIYSHWLKEDDPVLTSLKAAYECCDLMLNPPMAMDMDLFPNCKSIPLIVDSPDKINFSAKPGYRKKALVIFGGAGQPSFDIQSLAAFKEWLFLIPDAPLNSSTMAPENVQRVAFSQALKPIDLMPYVDAVVCKPGYGILAECWQTKTPITWVERPDFPEFPMLKKWLEDSLPGSGMSREQFRAGQWLAALERTISNSREFPVLECNGADLAAVSILSFAKLNK